jgi:aryl-alcohol dehydrogenase-like predicted oxidoreductase
MYGFGLSEEIVGQAVAGRREKVQILTKCGLCWDRSDGESYFETKMADGTAVKVYRVLKKDSIIGECERSLKRLKTDYVDLYQCHWMDQTTPVSESMEALLALQQQGKVRHIGVSNFSVEAMQECLKCGRVESDQPRYSLMDRKIEADVLPFCREKQLGVICYSPMEHGLLTGKVTPERKLGEGDLRSWNPWLKACNWPRFAAALERMHEVADRHGATLAQIAVAWVCHQPGVTAALVGARNPQQVEENAGVLQVCLSDDDRRHLAMIFEELGKPASA